MFCTEIIFVLKTFFPKFVLGDPSSLSEESPLYRGIMEGEMSQREWVCLCVRACVCVCVCVTADNLLILLSHVMRAVLFVIHWQEVGPLGGPAILYLPSCLCRCVVRVSPLQDASFQS